MIARAIGLRLFVIAVAASLVGFGLMVLASVSEATGVDYAARQLRWAGIAAGALVLVASAAPSAVIRRAWLLYLGCLGLLALVPLVGVTRNASRRWLELGVSVQPSELMKVALIVVLARLLRHRDLERGLGALMLPGFVFAVPALLVFAQPDLGTTLVFVPVALAMLFVSGLPKRQMAAIACSGVAFAALGWTLFLEPYQRARVVSTFLRSRLTEADRLVGSYQLEQSIRSIGIGGWTGEGLGEGLQNRVNALPYRHNDFIFAVLSEETGFLGAAALVVLILLLVLLIFRVAVVTRDPAGRLVAVGVGTLIGFQSFVHVGVNLGIVPTTGMTLPFVSAGGTSLLTFAAALGLVLGIARRPGFGFGSDPVREQVERLRHLERSGSGLFGS